MKGIKQIYIVSHKYYDNFVETGFVCVLILGYIYVLTYGLELWGYN